MTDFSERRRILPKTGQTTSYRDGDDGYYESGWNEATRFKDVGDGTILDIATGLMWPKDFEGDGANSGNTLTWNDGIDWANALDFAGFTNWKIPNLLELISIINWSLDPVNLYDIFNNPPSEALWTSSTITTFPAQAFYWYAAFAAFLYTDKADAMTVSAVRKA